MELKSINRKTWLGCLSCCLLITACGNDPTTSSSDFPALASGRYNRLLVNITDYQSGQLTLVQLNSGEILLHKAFPHADSLLRAPEGAKNYYSLNRFGRDSVQQIDRESFRSTEYSLGALSNPQDLLLWKGGAYISLRGKPELAKVRDTKRGVEIQSFNFSSLDPQDGNPDMNYMIREGENLLIQLQRQKNFVPTEVKSLVAVFDLQTQTLRESIELIYKNPFTEFKRNRSEEICVGSMGERDKWDGGIECFSRKTLKGSRSIIGESELEGDIYNFEWITETLGVALVGNGNTVNLVKFNPTTGKRIGDPVKSFEQYTGGLTYDAERSLLFVADRDPKKPAVLTYDAKTLEELVALRFDVGGLPFQLVLSE